MSEKSYRDPFAVHAEQAAIVREQASQTPVPTLSGDEIACVVGGFKEKPIPALFNPGTRTVFPVRTSD